MPTTLTRPEVRLCSPMEIRMLLFYLKVAEEKSKVTGDVPIKTGWGYALSMESFISLKCSSLQTNYMQSYSRV